MNTASTLAKHLSETQRHAIRELVESIEFLPISCLFWRHDPAKKGVPVIRTIPDDFFYIPTKGALDCVVGDERRAIEPGEFIMAAAGVPHGVSMANYVDYYEAYALHVHLYDATRYRVLKKMESPFGALPHVEDWVPRLAACTCMMGRDTEAGGTLMKQLVVSLLMEQLFQGRRMRELPAKTDQRIAKLLGRISANPADQWTVVRMAKSCHLSVSRFRELFAETTGTAPKKYVQKVRLSLARSLLMTRPELTVEQVSDMVGVSDAHYFHAIYKGRFGETPRQRSPFLSE